MTRRWSRSLGAAALVLAVASILVGCSSGANQADTPTTSPSSPSSTTPAPTTTVKPGSEAIVFVSVGGNIDAYSTQAPYTRQRVVAAGTAPGGAEPHGQICFLPDGTKRFVVAETSPAGVGTPASAGYGVYQVGGDGIGSLRVARVSGFTSPGSGAAPATATYGCAFSKAGELFTTVTGTVDPANSQAGAADGQVLEWFPPFTPTTTSSGGSAGSSTSTTSTPSTAPFTPSHCVVATGLSVPQGLAADPDGGSIDVASAGAPTAGVWRYTGSFPTKAGSCTSPMAGIAATKLIPAGANGVNAPSAVAASSDGKSLVVTSALDGVIAQYGVDGTFASTLLTPSPAAPLGATPYATGTPLGVAVNADGAIFYADPGLARSASGVVAPAPRAGSVRRIAVASASGAPSAPTVLNQQLPGPDGLGLYDPEQSSGGAGSIT